MIGSTKHKQSFCGCIPPLHSSSRSPHPLLRLSHTISQSIKCVCEPTGSAPPPTSLFLFTLPQCLASPCKPPPYPATICYQIYSRSSSSETESKAVNKLPKRWWSLVTLTRSEMCVCPDKTKRGKTSASSYQLLALSHLLSLSLSVSPALSLPLSFSRQSLGSSHSLSLSHTLPPPLLTLWIEWENENDDALEDE